MKKFSALALCVVLLFSLAMPVGARNFGYAVDDSDLIAASMMEVQSEEITVTADGKIVEAEVSTIGDENIPVTYVLVMDCSSSLSEFQKKSQRSFVNTFAARLRPVDKLVVARMGGKFTIGNVLTSEAEIKAELSADMSYAWGIMLYDNMIRVLDALKDEQTYPGLKCVVVVSDGRDDQLTEVKESDAREALIASDIPVFGVGIADQFPENYYKNIMTNFENLCKASKGGACFTMDQGAADAAKAADGVVNLVKNRAAVKLNAGMLERNGETVEVMVSAGASSFSVEVPVEELPAYIAATEAPTVPTYAVTVPETTAPTVPTSPVVRETVPAKTNSFLPSFDSNMNFYLLIGGGIAAIVAAVVVLILLLRPRYEYEEELGEDGSGIEFMPAVDPRQMDNIDLNISDDEWLTKPAQNTRRAEPVFEVNLEEQGCVVRLISVQDKKTLTVKIPANGSKTVGRTSRSDAVLNELDNGLSGLHFELHWDGRALQLRDRGSTNGTVLNKARMHPNTWNMVTDGSRLSVGSYEYVVYYRKEAE